MRKQTLHGNVLAVAGLLALAVSGAAQNVNLRILQPAEGTLFRPNQTFEAVITMDPAVVGTVLALQVNLRILNTNFDPIEIRQPQATNRVNIRIPYNAAVGGELTAFASSAAPSLTNHQASRSIRVERYNAALRITSPADRSTLDLERPVAVEMSLNPEVAGTIVRKITVSLRSGRNNPSQTVEIAVVPGASQRASLQIPLEIAGSEGMTIEARIDSVGLCEGGYAACTVNIGRLPSGMSISSPRAGQSVRPGEDLAVTIEAGQAAMGRNEGLVATLRNAGRDVAEIRIPAAQPHNSLILRIPVDMSMADSELIVQMLPGLRFQPNVLRVPVRVEFVDAGVDIPSVQNNAAFPPGAELNLSVSVSPRAAPTADRLRVTLAKDGRPVQSQDVIHPGPVSQVRLRVPDNAQPNEMYILTATLMPEASYRNPVSQRTLIIRRINAGLRITRPQDGTTVYPGSAVAVEMRLNQDAIGFVPSLRAQLWAGGLQDNKEVNNPGVASSATVRVPDAARPGSELIVRALISIPGIDAGTRFENFLDEKRLVVGKVPADVRITAPGEGSTVQPGQDLPVTVATGKAAASHVERITVSLLRNGQPVADIQIPRPGFMGQGTLKVPTGLKPTDRITLRAVAEPNDLFESFQTEATIRVERPKADLRITSPRDNEKVSLAQGRIDVAVGMDKSCEGIAESLIVSVLSGGRTIAERTIPGPRSETRLTLQLPPDLKPGTYQIRAVVRPESDILSGGAALTILVEK